MLAQVMGGEPLAVKPHTGPMENGMFRHPHQYPGTESGIFCTKGLPKKQIQFECPFTDGQLNSMCLCEQKRWHTLESTGLVFTWAWCVQHKIRAQHVPGKLHLEPYYESRHSNDPSDWQLKPQFIQKYLSPDSGDFFATHSEQNKLPTLSAGGQIPRHTIQMSLL